MKLLELNLTNFRQHRATNFILPSGLVGVVGPNGSGKSTLIEAFSFALFGSRALRGKVDEVKSRGATRDAICQVILVFELDGFIYRVERTLSDAHIYVGGESEPLVSGNREVSARISSLMRMTLEEFTATFLTEQKGLEFLSGKRGAAERERFIVRMLGYDKLERVQEILRGDKRDKKSSLQGFEGGLGAREEIELRIKKEEHELSLSEEAHSEASRVVERAEKEATLATTILARLDKRHLEYRQKKEVLLSLEARSNELGKRLAQIEKELNKKPTLLENLHAKFLEFFPDSMATSCESILEGEVFKIKSELGLIESKIISTEQEWQSNRAALKREIEIEVRQENELSLKLSDLVQLKNSAACPTCGQPLGTHFETACQGFSSEILQSSGRKKSLEVALDNLSHMPEELSDLRLEKNKVESRLSQCQGLYSEFLKAQAEIQQFDRISSEHRQLIVQLSEIQNELEIARKKISEVHFDENQYSQSRSHSDSCNRLLEMSRLQRIKLEGEVTTHKALLARTQSDLKEYDFKKHELVLLKRSLSLLEEGDQILTDFRRYLNTQIRPRLAELASEFLAELTDGRYTTVEITNDFTPTVLEDGIVKGVISGGEEDLLNLCMRLALSHMLAERAGQSFSLLVLDEVFGSLDENRRVNVLTLLDRLGSQFEQIIVITHLEDIREGVQYLYSVDYDENTGDLAIYDRLAREESEMVSNL